MKCLISFILLAGITTAVSAQDLAKNDVPSEVLDAFKTNFSDAKDAEWEMEGDLYKVEFEVGRDDHEVWIDKSGTISKRKAEISRDELPAPVLQKLKSDYKDYKIEDVDKIEADGEVYFEIELDGKSRDLDLVLAQDGSVKQGGK